MLSLLHNTTREPFWADEHRSTVRSLESRLNVAVLKHYLGDVDEGFQRTLVVPPMFGKILAMVSGEWEIRDHTLHELFVFGGQLLHVTARM